MGKEKKYNGLPKCKMIEHLFRVVAMKKSKSQQKALMSLMNSTSDGSLSLYGKQRKKDTPISIPSAATAPSLSHGNGKLDNTRVCQNSACRAVLRLEDSFCKRCSCCICHQFDENKDPSVWLFCSSESPNEHDSCGLSCHIECALKHKKAGVVKDGQCLKLDGCYCCPSCGRVSSILGCWKKQLVLAKDARRVDILCYRMSLSRRLLDGTERFKHIQEFANLASEALEDEVGDINGVSSTMARGIVSRLSCCSEVQKLCNLAISEAEPLISRRNLLLLGDNSSAACSIEFEDVSSTSLVLSLKELDSGMSKDVIGYKLWHCKSREENYPEDPTCILPKTQKRALISSLQPCTEYSFKIVAFTDADSVGSGEAVCFTKSLDTFQKKGEISLNSGESKNFASFGIEDFSSTNIKCEPESQLIESVSGFKVRDLGKIFREAWAHEHDPTGSLDCSDKTEMGNHCHEREKLDSDLDNKPNPSSEDEPNHVSSSPLEVSRDDQIGCNVVQVAELEDTNAESVSALDEERVMAGIGLLKMSRARQRPRKDPTKTTIRLMKKDNENFKVMRSKSPPSGNGCKNLSPNNLDNGPANSPCKLDDHVNGISRNGYTRSNGSDSENWMTQSLQDASVVECENGNSRKRTFSSFQGLSDFDAGLQNGHKGTPGLLEKNFEHSIKVIRMLECEGHIKEEFRKKLLTWFSLRASAEERRIIYAFIDTLIDDPEGLAEQLIDSFSEIISNKKPQVLPKGFCTRLWH